MPYPNDTCRNAFDFLDWALRQPIPNRGTKLVLVGLARHAGNDGENCYPTHAMLAGYAGCGPRRVRDHLIRLRDAGLISWKLRNTPKGRKANVYTLHTDVGEALSPPEDGVPVDTGSPVEGTGSPVEDVVASPPEGVVEPTGTPIAAKEHFKGTFQKNTLQGTSPAREKSPAGKGSKRVQSVPSRSSGPLGRSGRAVATAEGSPDVPARPDPERARKVLAQAKAEGVFGAAMPAADSEAIDAAGELVEVASAAWSENVRGAEVASILAVAHGLREPRTEPTRLGQTSEDVEAIKAALKAAVAA